MGIISVRTLSFEAFNEIAKSYPQYQFIIPLHPNPLIREHKYLLTNISVMEPLPHQDLIELLSECAFVITDSGGIQEEASFLKKLVLVCRESTERPEGIGLHAWLVTPESLKLGVESVVNGFYHIPSNFKCPYGDGNTSYKIGEILNRHIRG